jgi:succinoglycan biosynthesis transport protein ExoP
MLARKSSRAQERFLSRGNSSRSRGHRKVQQGSETFGLEQVLSALRRRLPLIALCAVIAAAAAYGISKRQTKKYTATASLAFSYNPLSEEIAGLPAVSSDSLVAQQASSNIELVRLGGMAAKTAGLLGHGLTAEKVASSVSVEARGESSVVSVSATAASPTLAAAIANTYTRDFVKEQQSTNREYVKTALAAVDKQLAALTRQQRNGADGLQLESRAQTLKLLEELNYGNVQLTQEAATPSTPSSPKTSKNTLLGLLLGLLVGLGLAVMLERLDRRVRRAGDLEAVYGLPLLGAVPKSAALSRSAQGPTGQMPPREAEAFRSIRAQLRFIGVGRDLRTVAIAASGPGEGTTTIACHLAEAAARLGSSVLLVDGDLRQPAIAQRFGVHPTPGLADVLAGSSSVGDATQRVGLASVNGGVNHTLDVLVAGTAHADPAELLESPAMEAILAQARSTYDFMIIDTPSPTIASDAFSLLTKVDGAIIVGRVGRNRRNDAENLKRLMLTSGARLLGLIANEAKNSGATVIAPPRAAGVAQPRGVSVNGASAAEEWLSSTKS